MWKTVVFDSKIIFNPLLAPDFSRADAIHVVENHVENSS